VRNARWEIPQVAHAHFVDEVPALCVHSRDARVAV
jgi:hypothetical protein